MMKNILSLLFSTFLFFSFLLLPNGLLAQSIQPGIWKANSDFRINGVPLPSSEEEECIKPEEAKNARATIEKELKKNGCELNTWNHKGKKLQAVLKCQNDQFEAKGSLRGEISDKSYSLTGEAEGTIQGILPSTASLVLKGHWVKACVR